MKNPRHFSFLLKEGNAAQHPVGENDGLRTESSEQIYSEKQAMSYSKAFWSAGAVKQEKTFQVFQNVAETR